MRDQWKMRENHLFMMYYFEILLSFLDYKALHPCAQKLIQATRFLLRALHLTKGFSNEVYMLSYYYFFTYCTHFMSISSIIRKQNITLTKFGNMDDNIYYTCIYLLHINSPFQKNASMLQKTTLSVSCVPTRVLLVTHA